MTMMMMMNTPIFLPPEQLSQAFSESRDCGYAMQESKYEQ
jgi:hypothetical protein